MASVLDARDDVESIVSADGSEPLVQTEGLDEVTVNDLRSQLDDVMDSLSVYKGTWRLRHPRPSSDESTDDDIAEVGR